MAIEEKKCPKCGGAVRAIDCPYCEGEGETEDGDRCWFCQGVSQVGECQGCGERYDYHPREH